MNLKGRAIFNCKTSHSFLFNGYSATLLGFTQTKIITYTATQHYEEEGNIECNMVYVLLNSNLNSNLILLLKGVTYL